MKPVWATLTVLALVVPAVAQAAPGDGPVARFSDDLKFSNYHVAIYKGPVARLRFAGSQRKYATYRMAIREAVKAGPNFAGYMAAVTVGCGLDCGESFVTDVRSGLTYGLPDGVEDHFDLRMYVHRDSRLMLAQWRGDDMDRPTCTHAFYVWAQTKFRWLQTRTVKGRCPDLAAVTPPAAAGSGTTPH